MRKFKLIPPTMALTLSLGFTAFAQEALETETAAETAAETEAASTAEGENPETITITCLNGSSEETELEVPYDPQRIAILDMASLDILDNLGVGGRVVGSADTSLEYLQDYAPGDGIENLGTIKEADLEAVMACEPDVIFIGGRLSESYDALSEIAPVVYLATDSELGKTVILVLHEINYAAFYSDYICAFADGKIAKFDTVKEVMTKDVLSGIYHVDFEIMEIQGKPLSIYY